MTVSVIVGKEIHGAVPFHQLPFHLLLPKPPKKQCTYPIFSLVEDLWISMIAYPIFNIEKGLYVHFSSKLIAKAGCTFESLDS